jgi:hypothetical protein
MHRFSLTVSLSAALAAAAGGPTAHATLMIDPANNIALDVDYEVGAGAHTSYLIVDFEATGGDTYAFAYHWDLGARGYDMLVAVTDYVDGLDWVFGGDDGVGFGVFVENFTYDAFGESGDPGFYWSYSLGSVGDGMIDFTESAVGPSNRYLEADSIDGWYNGFTGTFEAIPPRVPTMVIPGPAPLAIISGLIIFRGRGRRRRADGV